MRLVLLLLTTALGAAELEVTTSWIGNDAGGADDRHVQMDGRCLFVAADGTCFTNVPWEEGGRQAGVYRDGAVLPNPGFTHGWGNEGGHAVVADERYVFIAQGRNNEGGGLQDAATWPAKGLRWDGLTRRTRASGGREAAPFPGGKGGAGKTLADCFLVVNESPAKDKAPIRGLALDGDRLYLANTARDEILVHHAETMERLARFDCPRPHALAVDAAGALWVVSGALDQWNRRVGDEPVVIRRFAADGSALPQVIADIHSPSGLAVGPGGRLYVSDNGPDQQVHVYAGIDTTPRRVASLGQRGGILAGTPGVVEPDKLHGPQGVGVDAEGGVYVAANGHGGNGSGFTLKAFAPAAGDALGALRWELRGLEFVDCGGFDPASDGATIYTTYERFDLALDDPARRGAGREWDYAAFTLDWRRYGDDPRVLGGPLGAGDTVWVRRIEGRPVLFSTGMYSGFLSIYRTTDADPIVVPCGYLTKGGRKDDFPYKPEDGGRSLWLDDDGDGAIEPAECRSDGVQNPHTWAWWVDSEATIWQAPQDCSGIFSYRCQGLDEHGVPRYDLAAGERSDPPAPFADKAGGSKIERVLYVPATDVMYLGGYTPEHPNPGGWWKQVGTELARYEDWSGERRLAWRLVLPVRGGEDPVSSFTVAGDLLFTAQGARRGVLQALQVYDVATGVHLAEVEPDEALVGHHTGWVDIPYGIDALQRRDGEYLVLMEEDFRAKNLLLRLRAPQGRAPAEPSGLQLAVAGGRVDLHWAVEPAVAGYAIEQAAGDGDFTIVGHSTDGRFSARHLVNGQRYRFRVRAVDWGGSALSPAAEAVPEGPIAILQADFEADDASIPGVTIEAQREPRLADGGQRRGRLAKLNRLPAFALPPGATTIVIRYDRFYAEPHGVRARTHYTRQFLGFDTTGRQRHGEGRRFVLDQAQAGRWHEVRIEIPIPDGATRATGGELADIAEQATPGYANPVWIDNLRIVAR